tara:strand:- start:107936 stop:108691 length:756 start_codon:yes stop_codon:yes gene_type:complete
MLLKHAERLEQLNHIDDLWQGLVAALRTIGFDHAIHISVDADFGAPQVRCTMPGLYDHMPPQDDPFLHHSCKSYAVLTIGAVFLDLYPNVTAAERAFITRAGAAGLRAGFAVPMRLQGSDRFGGFIIGNGLDRASFESQFLPCAEEVRLFCLLMHRRIEDLTGTTPLPLPRLPPVFDVLSPRESEIIGLLAHGHSRQQTADICRLSIHTVSDYAKSGYRKLGISNRAQAAALIHATAADTAPDMGTTGLDD